MVPITVHPIHTVPSDVVATQMEQRAVGFNTTIASSPDSVRHTYDHVLQLGSHYLRVAVIILEDPEVFRITPKITCR